MLTSTLIAVAVATPGGLPVEQPWMGGRLDAGVFGRVATPVAPSTRPDPGLTANLQPAPRTSVMLLPDRRSVLVQFSRGACHGVAAATVTMRGRTITPRVTLGAPPDYEGLCIARLDHDSVLIRLPRPAPLGVKFT